MPNWRFWQRTRPVTIITEQAPQGKFSGQAYAGKAESKNLYMGEKSRRERWNEYVKITQTRSEIYTALMALAGHVISRGYITQPASDDDKAKQAKDICDSFAKQIALDQVIFEGTFSLGQNGTVIIQKKNVGQKLVDVRLFPWQEELEPSTIQADGQITSWRQVSYGQQVETFDADELIVLRIPPVDRDGFGTSLIQSVMKDLDTRDSIDYDSKAYIHKTAFPKELWQLGEFTTNPMLKVDGTTLSNAYAKIKNWVAGENYVTDYPIKYTACGTGNMESRILPPLIEGLDKRIVNGIMIPPLSYLYNSTEASAREMLGNLRIALIQPIQRAWKRKIETELFIPLLAGSDMPPELVPQISFTPPDEEELASKSARLREEVKTGIITADEAREKLDYGQRPKLDLPPVLVVPVPTNQQNPGNQMVKKNELEKA